VKVHKYLGDRVGKDILFVSISIDSDNDTPEVMKQYAAQYGDKKGWLYLTGDYDEIDALRKEMGVYDLDPVVDADKTQHAGLVTFGNDKLNRWAALPGLMDANQISYTIKRITGHRLTRRVSVKLPRNKAPVVKKTAAASCSTGYYSRWVA